MIHFLVDTDIASHIHFLKHRISSFNGESARYKELKEDKIYLPADWKGIKNSDQLEWLNLLKKYTEEGNMLYHSCLKDLEPVLGRKRAKESARFFKTYNSQIEGDVSFNMRSFANFYHLRNCKNAQKEIREIALIMFDLVSNIDGNPFEETLKMVAKYKPTKIDVTL